jgi:hypothetical protein
MTEAPKNAESATKKKEEEEEDEEDESEEEDADAAHKREFWFEDRDAACAGTPGSFSLKNASVVCGEVREARRYVSKLKAALMAAKCTFYEHPVGVDIPNNDVVESIDSQLRAMLDWWEAKVMSINCPRPQYTKLHEKILPIESEIAAFIALPKWSALGPSLSGDIIPKFKPAYGHEAVARAIETLFDCGEIYRTTVDNYCAV